MKKIDVAVNILAKPYMTSLAILSLLRQSAKHINALWLQFEPVGIEHDQIPAYCIYDYIKEQELVECHASQPENWLDLKCVDEAYLADKKLRQDIRYQTAFEHSDADYLFLMHNDVFFLKDLLGALAQNIGDAFAIGQLGQCWNCPAANAELMRKTLNAPACQPDRYQDTRLAHAQLLELYAAAQKNGVFVRPYAIQQGEFEKMSWPLPECRVNEWACLLNLAQIRPHAMPNGKAWPPGAYRACGEINLDIAVPMFRDLHAAGLHAKNFNIAPYMIHWRGTGNNTPIRYARQEGNALGILRKHFAHYVNWLEKRYKLNLT